MYYYFSLSSCHKTKPKKSKQKKKKEKGKKEKTEFQWKGREKKQ